MSKKFSDLYLMKTQISFDMQKNFKSILMKIQISFVVVLLKKKNVFSNLLQILKFKEEPNLKPRHVNQLVNKKLKM